MDDILILSLLNGSENHQNINRMSYLVQLISVKYNYNPIIGDL